MHVVIKFIDLIIANQRLQLSFKSPATQRFQPTGANALCRWLDYGDERWLWRCERWCYGCYGEGCWVLRRWLFGVTGVTVMDVWWYGDGYLVLRVLRWRMLGGTEMVIWCYGCYRNGYWVLRRRLFGVTGVTEMDIGCYGDGYLVFWVLRRWISGVTFSGVTELRVLGVEGIDVKELFCHCSANNSLTPISSTLQHPPQPHQHPNTLTPTSSTTQHPTPISSTPQYPTTYLFNL